MGVYEEGIKERNRQGGIVSDEDGGTMKLRRPGSKAQIGTLLYRIAHYLCPATGTMLFLWVDLFRDWPQSLVDLLRCRMPSR